MSPDSAPPTPPAEPPAAERGWVWHSTLKTKAAGKISVLAVVETVLACAGYWWFAFHFDTHLHLLTSILIAPLLLLRSPASIELGVKWALSPSIEDWDEWPCWKRRAWGALFAMIGAVAAYGVCVSLARAWLAETSGGEFFGKSAALCLLAIWVSVSVFVAGYASGAGFIKAAEAAVMWTMFAVMLIGVIVVPFAVAVIVSMVCPNDVVGGTAVAIASAASAALGVSMTAAVTVAAPALGAGWILRLAVCRVAASLRCFRQGCYNFPGNLREISLLTDSTLPPDLIPAVQVRDQGLVIAGWLREFWGGKAEDASSDPKGRVPRLAQLMFPVVMTVALFVVCFLIRLSLKATAWFWWPPACLLKPVPREDAEIS